MSLNTPPEFKQDIINSSGIPVPMSIKAVQDTHVLNSDEILAKINPETETGTARMTTSATRPTYNNANNIEITIDKNFVAHNKNLVLQNCSNFTIRGISEQITLNQVDSFFISIINCHSFTLEGLFFKAGYNAVLISHSSEFMLSKCKCQSADGFGLIIHNSSQFKVTDCLYTENRSGIMILGRSNFGKISNCICRDNTGHFNCDAGIHLCATSPLVTVEQIPHKCHEPLSITDKTYRPCNIVVENCTLSNCRAQGLYLEGAVNCLIYKNEITGNNKEGACFDWGSCYNIFTDNTVSLNGERSELTEEEIAADFISEFPILEDGSSSMKLPAISIDNGCMNLLAANRISRNHGGGIKMVRAAMFNVIMDNEIVDNAIGKNRYIPYFHGVSFLGLGAVNNEFDQNKDRRLDFLPSILNQVSRNTITGHYHSIFNDTISAGNYITANTCSHEAGFSRRLVEFSGKVKAKLLRIICRKIDSFQPPEETGDQIRNLARPGIERQALSSRLPRLFFCHILGLSSKGNWKAFRHYPHSIPTDVMLEKWQESEWPLYQEWINKNSICSQLQWQHLHHKAIRWKDIPRISIVTPVYNTDARSLRTCIQSVRIQTSPFWELILVDDGSSLQETIDVLNSPMCNDPRISILQSGSKKGTGISAATNRGIEHSSGDFIIFLDHDDRLAPEALQSVAQVLKDKPDLDIIYSDRDMISEADKRFMYLMKPDWSPENLYSANYIFHLMCYRKTLLLDAGKLRSEYDGGQDHDLILRCMERTSAIKHIPEVLYHYRSHEQSMATNEEAKSYAYLAGIRAIEDALSRRKITAEKVVENSETWRGNYQILLPPCPEKEIGKVNIPDSSLPEDYVNYVMQSATIKQGNEPFILIQRDGYHPESYIPVETMCAWLKLDRIGMVSGCLIDDDNRFVYAGITFDHEGHIITPYRGYKDDEPGYLAANKNLRNISGPDPYSVAIRRDLWVELEGFSQDYQGIYALFDFALRALDKKWRVIYNPQALFRSSLEVDYSRSDPKGHGIFRQKWAKWLKDGDPYYSPNMSRKSDHYELNLD